MNIIFGRDQAASMGEKYTVLELDTIRIGDKGPELTAFCVVENIPIPDMPKVDSMKSLHENLMIEYRKRNWNYCAQALDYLTGFWNHELDTFYSSMRDRINEYTDREPDDSWDSVIQKSQS